MQSVYTPGGRGDTLYVGLYRHVMFYVTCALPGIYICNPEEQVRCTRWSRDRGDPPSGICSPRVLLPPRTLRWLTGPTLDTSPPARSPTSTLTYCSVLTFLTEPRSLQAGAARSLSLQVSFVTTNQCSFLPVIFRTLVTTATQGSFYTQGHLRSVGFFYLLVYVFYFVIFF